MMLAWSFAARTPAEVAALLRALGKHRYVREVDLALHAAVDLALADDPRFAPHAAVVEHRRRAGDLDLASRDPSLWRRTDVEDVAAALAALWDAGPAGAHARARLREVLEGLGLPPPPHAPFEADPEEPPHPELVLLDWVLHPIVDLDPERHAGALAALEAAGEEVDPSAPVYQEGPCLAAPELLEGAPGGVLVADWITWSDGPYAYTDYVFRGAAKAARLAEPPAGPDDDAS
jgi:hypothetical protein